MQDMRFFLNGTPVITDWRKARIAPPIYVETKANDGATEEVRKQKQVVLPTSTYSYPVTTG